MKTADNQILATLPATFTRQQLLRATIERGYSISKANQITERAVITGEIERIKPGTFKNKGKQ